MSWRQKYEDEANDHRSTRLKLMYAREDANKATRRSVDSQQAQARFMTFLRDLAVLDPSLERFKNRDGGWDYEGVAAAAQHKRDRERLARFTAGKGNPEVKGDRP